MTECNGKCVWSAKIVNRQVVPMDVIDPDCPMHGQDGGVREPWADTPLAIWGSISSLNLIASMGDTMTASDYTPPTNEEHQYVTYPTMDDMRALLRINRALEAERDELASKYDAAIRQTVSDHRVLYDKTNENAALREVLRGWVNEFQPYQHTSMCWNGGWKIATQFCGLCQARALLDEHQP